MKSLFSEYYKLSAEEYNTIWNDALIVFDTNVLLDLYRYSADVSSDMISAMRAYSDRLWLPYQVAWEFHRNRIGIITGHIEAYNQLCSKLDTEISKAIDALKKKDNLYMSHPYIKFNLIEQSINNKVGLIKKNLMKQQEEYPIDIDNDSILEEITKLYAGKVGSYYSEADLKIIFSDAKKRYEHKVPPGYCDEDNKKELDDQQLYGDVILWYQIIDKSKAENKSIIFVSNDEKEDWRLKSHGRNISARKELIKEFSEKTGQKILIYNSQRFLEYVRQHKIDIKANTIRKVKAETARRNEQAQNSDDRKYDIFSSINFDAIRELSERLGQYSASMRRMQEQISSSIAIPTINPPTLMGISQKDEIIEEYERQRAEMARIIAPINNNIKDEK